MFRSLSFRLTVLVVMLTALLVVFVGLNFLKLVEDDRRAESFQLRTNGADQLNRASAILALERGVGHAVLGGNEELIDRFKQLGRQSDERVRAAEAAISDIVRSGAEIPELNEKISDWKKGYAGVQRLRARVETGKIDAAAWFDAATDNIFNVFDLRDWIFTPLDESEAVLYYNTVLRPNITVLAEFAGRERALIGNVLASGWSISPETLIKLRRFRGRVDLAARRITSLKQLSTTPRRLKTVIEEFERTFLGTFEDLRLKIYAVSEQRSETISSAYTRLTDDSGRLLRLLHGNTADLLALSQNPHLQEQVKNLISGEPADFSRVAAVFKDFNDLRRKYDQVRYLDAAGRERVRVDRIDGRNEVQAENRLKDKGHRYYFQESKNLAISRPYISPLDLNVEGGRIEIPFVPTLRYAMAVAVGRVRHGIVVLNFDANPFLDALPQNVILIDENGFYLRHPDAAKEWGMMAALDRRSANFRTDYPEAAARFFGNGVERAIVGDSVFLAQRTPYHPEEKKRFWLMIDQVQPPPYPIGSTDWIEAATDAIDSAIAISETVGQMAMASTSSRRRVVNFEEALLLVLTFILVATLTWFFREFFVAGQKMRRIFLGLEKLAAGDLGHRIEVPAAEEARSGAGMPTSEFDAISVYVNRVAGNLEQSMEALSDSEERLRATTETVQAGIMVVDTHDGTVLFANAEAKNILGSGALGLFGTNWREVYIDLEGRENLMSEFSATGSVKNRELRVRGPGGEPVWILISLAPIPSDEELMLLASFIDITERKAAEEAVKASKEELERAVIDLNASRSDLERQAADLVHLAETEAVLSRRLKYENDVKNRFFSIIAHDLKSPFSSLLAMTELMTKMADRLSKEKLVEYAHDVDGAGRRVFDLLRNLLDWARLQMEGGEVEPEPLRLAELTRETVAVLAPVADEKGITLSNVIEDASAFGDREMTRTVIRNLIANALKFTPEGGRVEISSRNFGGLVQVTVSDTGVGMSEEQVAGVFALDQKTSTNGTAGETGTGLGLTLCKDMLERNGGRIWIESKLGEGSQFHFTLPAGPET